MLFGVLSNVSNAEQESSRMYAINMRNGSDQ